MQIRDYEIINNIHLLFEQKIVIYGGGVCGKHIFNILREAQLSVDFICDRNKNQQTYDGVKIISPCKLRKIDSRKYLVIVASDKYRDEMIEVLSDMEIDEFVCTWYGVQAAIELNLMSSFFTEKFRQEYLLRKELNNKAFKLKRWFGIFYDLYNQNFDGLVYQPGKVGSSSVLESLKRYNKNMIHFHWCMYNIAEEEGFEDNIIQLYSNYAKLIRNRMNIPGNKVKIITIVREPIGRALSVFMEKFRNYGIDVKELYSDKFIGIANTFVSNNILQNDEFEWFNKELLPLTGIDIMRYPFDKEKGYTIIEEGNFEILILKMEKLNENEEVIGKFVNVSNFKLVNANVGADKRYKYIYQGVKENFRLSENVFDEIFINNKFIEHFYSNEEIRGFAEKWNKYVK